MHSKFPINSRQLLFREFSGASEKTDDEYRVAQHMIERHARKKQGPYVTVYSNPAPAV